MASRPASNPSKSEIGQILSRLGGSQPESRGMYEESLRVLKDLLGDSLEKLKPYMHMYTGDAKSVKPVSKHITIYWVGRLGAEAVLRTEGEDDIILTKVRDKAVPTLIFRKFKATMLRAYMETMRMLWLKYSNSVRELLSKHGDLYKDYDFLKCGISPGISGKGEGVMQERCMKCPVDVLMGAVSGGEVSYNLASRFTGDPAYATTDSYRRRTGNAVDEVTYTTGMGGRKTGETGALYTETIVEPGTIFVGKTVLFMASPVELVYTLSLLSHVHRYGARKSIMGSMEIQPVVAIGDYYEVGTSYAAVERVLGKTQLDEVASEVFSYASSLAVSGRSVVVDLRGLKRFNIDSEKLYLEAWENAANYVKGVEEYLGAQK